MGVEMKKSFLVGLLVVLCLVGLVLTITAGPQAEKPKMMGQMQMKMQPTRSMCELRAAMRKLWEDHIVWTRCYIVSALAKLEDGNAAAQRLLANQDDIGNAIKPFYGDGAGKKLAGLLHDHIVIATEVVKAAMTNVGLPEAQKKWTDNADAIAVFLSGANSHWAKADLVDMLYKHLALTTDEVVSRLKKDWGADIAAYDKNHAHMLSFSDILTRGIVMQFPDKFKE